MLLADAPLAESKSWEHSSKQILTAVRSSSISKKHEPTLAFFETIWY
jgi:hypothetical protein